MTERVSPAIRKGGVLVVGLGAAVGGFAVGLVLFVLVSLGCSGTDASQPSESAICGWYWTDMVALAGWAAAAGGPFFGTAVSLAEARWRPLWIGIAVSLAGILMLALLMNEVRPGELRNWVEFVTLEQ